MQDPSSWNKPLIYRTKAAATSTDSATATATATSAASVAVAATSATAPGTVSGPSALPPPNIHSRSSAPTPCLTSSHVRPNTNTNSDVLAIHSSFDLTKAPPQSEPSSPSPSTPLSSPASQDTINAIVAYHPSEEPLLSSSPPDASSSSSSSLQIGSSRQHDWLQYNSKPAVSSLRDLPKDRAQDVENHATDRRNLGTGLDQRGIDSSDDVDMALEAPSMSSDSSKTDEGRSRRKRISASAPLTRRVSSNLDGVERVHRTYEHGSTIGEGEGNHRGEYAGPTMDNGYSSHSAIHGHVPVQSSNKVIPTLESDISKSEMPPSDVFHFSSSSAGTTPTSVRSSSSSSSSVTSVSPPTSPVLSSPEGRSKSGLLPSGSFHRSSRSLAPTIKSSASSSLGRSTDENSSRQREIVHKGIFLPNFLSSIRPSSQAVQASQQDRKEHRSRRAEDRDQSPERSRPHIVVTDVKSISFRDISTVPTLTTFGHKRSKRRNSSLSYSGSPSSSDSLCASLSSLPTTSRRKRIKKSSSHSRTSLRNLCTSSCGCSKSQSLSTAGADETTVVSERKRTHKRAKDQSGRIMDSTERIRTLSESEVSMSDHSQASHQLLHQHQQQQGRDQEQNHGMMQDSIQQLHMEHHRHHQQALPQAEHQEHHQPLTASQGLHDTQHSYRDGKEQHVSSNKPPLRIQLCHDRDQHHKRQRSPQTPSFQSSLSSSSTPSVNSMDRQKRARRLSSATPEEIANNGSDSRRHSQCGVQQEGAIQHPKPTMALQHQAAVPFDHESSTTNPTQRSSGNNVSENGTSVRKQHSSIPTTARRAPEHGSELISSKSAPSANPAPSTARVSTPKSAKDTSTSSKPTPGPLPAFNPATLALPITRETLRELDVPEIFKNPQVRHDVVFDPLLQFRPNFDGERGQSKRREADRFWSEVGKELNNRRSILAARRETTTNTLNMTGVSASSPTSRMIQQQAEQMWPLPKAVLLPRLIEELREILLTLIYRPGAQAVNPDGTPQVSPEQALLMSTLDPDLLMQELDHGVLDVHALFRFLGDRLKGHCAPMRDALVESMVNIVVDFDEIVRGIRMCFEILEWMKLDIANHQLRAMRPWLLDNAITFERKFFATTIARGGSIARTTDWYKRSWIKWEGVKSGVIGQPTSGSDASLGAGSRRPSLTPSTSSSSSSDTEQSGSESRSSKSSSSSKRTVSSRRRGSIVRADIGENILDGVVNEGLLDMILHPHKSTSTMPEAFELDHYRLLSFHNDFQDLTILCVLLILFRQLAQNCWTQQDLIEIKKVVWLLLTDENANFGANTNPGPGATAAASGKDTGNGLKDIVIQIQFAAQKVRERNSKGSNASSDSAPSTRRSSVASESSSAALAATVAAARRRSSLSPGSMVAPGADQGSSSGTSTPSLSSTAAPAAVSNVGGSDTNLLTAWLDNALCKTSKLYQLIQKRLMIHFRRWLYVHSSSSMMVLSASCASLASAMSMSNANGAAKSDEDDEDENNGTKDGESTKEQGASENGQGNAGSSGATTDSKAAAGSTGASGAAGTTEAAAPPMTPEEANKAAAEALAAKLSFNPTEMEAHGLTGLEDEMTALLEKIRAVSEYNKKVYGSWYLDMIKTGRAENWLDQV